MSTTEIITELPKLTQRERRRILERLMELEDEALLLESRREIADEVFQLLDALEAEDAANSTR